MALEIDKDCLCINRIIGQKSENSIVEGDVIVPDIKPDILNTIHTNGNVCIYKKEVADGKVKIDGSINIYMMYLADNEQNEVRALNTNLDFTQTVLLEEAKVGMSLEEQTVIKSIDCRVLNGRKINIKVGLEIKTKVYSNEDVNFMKQINNVEDIQVLEDKISINSLVGEGCSKTYAKDTIIVDNIDNLAEILKAEVCIINKDTKVSYNKVLAKADLAVKLLYLTEDNRINLVESNIPIMGFIDIPNVAEEHLCDMRYEMKNLIIKMNAVEEHSVYIEAEIELNCRVYENKEIQMIQDLYSPSQTLTFAQKSIQTMTGKNCIKDVCSIRQSEMIPEVNGNKIYDVEVIPSITNATILKDRIVYEGEILLKLLFSSDNVSRMDTKNITIPYNFTVDALGITTSHHMDTQIETNSNNFVLMPDGSLDIKVDLHFTIDISKNVTIPVIDEINLEETRNINIYSMVIYFVKPGDTLWKIAKQFRSTVADIMRVNEIEDENKIMPGQQLFIPKYVGGTRKKTA